MKPPYPARRLFSDIEKTKIAWLAANGYSATQIAETIGNTSPNTISSFVRRMGISLVPKMPRTVAFVVKLSANHHARLEIIAGTRDEDPADLAGRALAALIDEPTVLANLLDELEE